MVLISHFRLMIVMLGLNSSAEPEADDGQSPWPQHGCLLEVARPERWTILVWLALHLLVLRGPQTGSARSSGQAPSCTRQAHGTRNEDHHRVQGDYGSNGFGGSHGYASSSAGARGGELAGSAAARQARSVTLGSLPCQPWSSCSAPAGRCACATGRCRLRAERC